MAFGKSNSGRHAGPGELIVRQKGLTRVTHWIWALCFVALLPSGLQIFNAHPTLYWGQQSGLEKPVAGLSNTVFSISAVKTPDGPRGETDILGLRVHTTGLLGLSGPKDAVQPRAFPAWATLPGRLDLATGRDVHFFFAWLFVATLTLWLAASLANGHLLLDLMPRKRDLRGLWPDVVAHLRGRLLHAKHYSPLQKLSYFAVLFGLFPLMIATGLAMSPGMDAVAPVLVDMFGGRQSARTLHFLGMTLLLAFFLVHLVMVLAAGPVNELRSMITGKYRLSGRSVPGDRS